LDVGFYAYILLIAHRLKVPSNFKLRQASRVIISGGVIAYPTEAVFGLGCDPDCYPAVEQIFLLKRRNPAAGLILIADCIERLAGWAAPTQEEHRNMSVASPAPITWVVTADPQAADWITGGRPTIAVRITRHPVAADLCRLSETPLVSTSANRAGRAPARTALTVRKQFGRQIDLVISGQTGDQLNPTEIREARTGAVLRSA
jgi:L-threonylcarbamoyladenylate synthase